MSRHIVFDEDLAKTKVQGFIDYFCGRMIKADFRRFVHGDTSIFAAYDRDFGFDSAKKALGWLPSSTLPEASPVALQVSDDAFPLHVAWDKLGFASNEHFAVLKTLGLSPFAKGEKIPVPKHKCFFGQLRELGLIDDQGCASKPLEKEVKAKIAENTANKMVDTLGPSTDSPEVKKSRKRAIQDMLKGATQGLLPRLFQGVPGVMRLRS